MWGKFLHYNGNQVSYTLQFRLHDNIHSRKENKKIITVVVSE